jgi:hypothetical protein
MSVYMCTGSRESVFRVVLKDSGNWTVKICSDAAHTICVEGSINLIVKGNT